MNTLNKLFWAMLAGIVLLWVGGGTPTNADQPKKVTFCHVAGRADDPANYITLTLPWVAVYGQAGHFNENGTPKAGHEQDYLGKCDIPTTTTVTETTQPPVTTVPETTVPVTTVPETTVPVTTIPEAVTTTSEVVATGQPPVPPQTPPTAQPSSQSLPATGFADDVLPWIAAAVLMAGLVLWGATKTKKTL